MEWGPGQKEGGRTAIIRIKVPATSANLGPGFDSLGIALSLHNTVYMEESDTLSIAASDNTKIPTDENNLIYKSVKELYSLCDKPLNGLRIRQENNIPMTRGLGSSSACIVAGLAGGNELLGHPLSTGEIVNMAARLEGHPDNSTPAILGGLVVAVLENGAVYSAKVPVTGVIRFAAFIPDFELKTEVARAALPKEIPHRDAVYNLSRSALMAASLFSGRLDNLRVAAGDRLHQPYRIKLIHGAEQIFDLAYGLGAYAVYISGAGPTIMAMINGFDRDFEGSAKNKLEKDFPGWKLKMMDCDSQGVTVETGFTAC